jgi:DNA-binding transcriptional MerR regulator
MSESLQTSTTSYSSPAPSSALPTSEMKSPTAFRTISEVAEGLALPQHVLRFWESKFQQIKPLKRGGGRRYYRPEDVKIIHDIKELLYNQGFTIRGVQKLLRENNSSSLARSMVAQPQLPMSVQSRSQPATPNASAQMTAPTPQQPQGLSSDKRREMEGVLVELRAIRKVLQQSGI